MNKRKIFRIVIMVLIMILLVASPALAEATKTEWWEQSTYCDVSCPEGEVCDRLVDGKIYQRRGLVQHIDVLSFDPNDGNPIEIPELHGTITSIANVNYNLDTGNGVSWGTSIREFDYVEGTFETTWNGQIRDGHFSGKFVGKGTGDLEGLIVKGWLNDVLNNDLPLGASCDPDEEWGWGEVNYGYIIEPHGE